MRIFATGATGYIGRVVTERALAECHAVYGLSQNEECDARLKALGATAVRGGLTSLDVLRQESARAKAVLHLAYIHDFGMDYVANLRPERPHPFRAPCTAPERRRCPGERGSCERGESR
jgi:nucleoside-diphosphate-sugar epimerase